MSGNDERMRIRRRVASDATLRAGERLMPFYCWDLAWCECAASTHYLKIPCVPVAMRGRSKAGRIARCLACGVRWLVPEQRRIDRIPAGAVR